MSLYNLVFGEQPLAPFLLKALGTDRLRIPRYRDCFIVEQDGAQMICVHTRTGGGNREQYEKDRAAFGDDYQEGDPMNDDLRLLPGYLRDEDDDFDCTYANFFFSIPAPLTERLAGIPASEPPGERWRKALEAIRQATYPENSADV